MFNSNMKEIFIPIIIVFTIMFLTFLLIDIKYKKCISNPNSYKTIKNVVYTSDRRGDIYSNYKSYEDKMTRQIYGYYNVGDVVNICHY